MVNFKRDGQNVWPTCTACGCRLEIECSNDDALLTHFNYGMGDYDARGCKCPAIDMVAFSPAYRVIEFVNS